MAVSTSSIVGHLDVIEYIGARQISSFVDALFDTISSAIVGMIDQPITLRAYRSTTTAR